MPNLVLVDWPKLSYARNGPASVLARDAEGASCFRFIPSGDACCPLADKLKAIHCALTQTPVMLLESFIHFDIGPQSVSNEHELP